MIIELEFNVKPITSNHYEKITTRGRFPTMYKTANGKAFDSLMNAAMIKQKSIYKKLNSVYDETKHYLVVDYVFHLPFMTKANTIGKRNGDVDNFVKYTQDNIFKHLIADDSAIIHSTQTKVQSERYLIRARIALKSLDQLQ